MNKALLFTLVLASAPAVAQPITRPDACGATIAYAPDDVRTVVEQWLRQESSCNVTLEIRIVPTDGGLYLFARDEHGRVRERLVPDAQAAGVLVTSWMADDSKLPAPVVAPVATPGAPAYAPTYAPGLRAQAEPIDSAPVIAKPSHPKRMLGFGPLLQDRIVGWRAELDALSAGAWSLGAAVSHMELVADVIGPSGSWHFMEGTDTTFSAYVVRRMSWGRWQLRPLVGLGVTYVSASEMGYVTGGGAWEPQMNYVEEVVVTKEVSLSLGRSIGDNWQIDGGLRFFRTDRGAADLERIADGSFFTALRYRL
ncbi:MAG TPA: hypothetical protein VIV11_32870 [Kofleriaceae bacterium]